VILKLYNFLIYERHGNLAFKGQTLHRNQWRRKTASYISQSSNSTTQIMILDEPTSHLDFGNQIRTLNIIKKISDRGLSAIMTSHYPDHTFISSNRVAILNKGSLMAIGDPEEVITEKNMRETYGIDVKILNIENHRKAVIPLEIKY
jgi:iron complex transport system ATP-binding protein